MSAWVSPPQESTSHMVVTAASMAHAASTGLPPFWKIMAPAVAASGLPVMATQWRPCSAGFWVRWPASATGEMRRTSARKRTGIGAPTEIEFGNISFQCAARWRAAGWNDMLPNSISVGAPMPVRFLALVLLISPVALAGQRTQKPALHGRHWVAITGKPLAATAGAMIFQKGGNPVDAACAMLAAVTTMWDVLSLGGETQASTSHIEIGRAHV